MPHNLPRPHARRLTRPHAVSIRAHARRLTRPHARPTRRCLKECRVRTELTIDGMPWNEIGPVCNRHRPHSQYDQHKHKKIWHHSKSLNGSRPVAAAAGTSSSAAVFGFLGLGFPLALGFGLGGGIVEVVSVAASRLPWRSH